MSALILDILWSESGLNFVLSKLSKLLLLTILLILLLTVYLVGSTKILLIGLCLIFLIVRLQRLVDQFREDQKIERMGDYVTAYKLAQNFCEKEATVVGWCKQGWVPGAFQRNGLWLIPRDFAKDDLTVPMFPPEYGRFDE